VFKDLVLVARTLRGAGDHRAADHDELRAA
jgi:hypothetical protein